jgi:hypothetical protein
MCPHASMCPRTPHAPVFAHATVFAQTPHAAMCPQTQTPHATIRVLLCVSSYSSCYCMRPHTRPVKANRQPPQARPQLLELHLRKVSAARRRRELHLQRCHLRQCELLRALPAYITALKGSAFCRRELHLQRCHPCDNEHTHRHVHSGTWTRIYSRMRLVYIIV